eukprot:Hpha_TRINITY_DN12766_c0_g1::TRINITY_DN12766_c0_g1_i1::g.114696::m.114696
MYTSILVAISAVFLVVRAALHQQENTNSGDATFVKFRRQFVITYLIMMTADWLQGPTVYTLYKHYGFTHEQNAQLFIAGFGSSMIFGTFAGTLADKYGRRLNCVIYGVSYALCCITKHFNNYGILMIGRLLGGFATSILWSAFESWMVCEHNKRGFKQEWIGSTFSLMITGNGLVAIASGFAAQAAVWVYGGHPVAPFDLSLLCLIFGTVFISYSWTENYGDQHASQSDGLQNAFAAIRRDPNVALLGLLQSLFEGAMYTFVFMWTPVLEASGAVPHGFVFACFMMSCSVGASIFNILSARSQPESYMIYVFSIAAACMAGPVLTTDPFIIMCCFCGFEVCVGIFWPSIMKMRSKYLPEEGRATIMNIFRIPLNALVCLVLANQGKLTVMQDFQICAGAHVLCAILQAILLKNSKKRPTSPTDVETK